MARTSSAALKGKLAVLLLSSMTLLALASVPVVKNKATEGTIDQQTAVLSSSYDRPALLRRSAARKLLASTYWEYKPGFDRDLQDRSKSAATLSVQAGATAGEALPFRRLLASTPTYDKDLEDRSAFTTSGLLENTRKRLEASAVTGAKADSTGPFRRLLGRDHTSDRDLEDRFAFAANPTLDAAVKRLEADAATTSSTGSAVPFRRLLARDHTSDRDLEDRSAVTNSLLQSAYKKFEAAQAVDGGSAATPSRRMAAAAAESAHKAVAQPAASR